MGPAGCYTRNSTAPLATGVCDNDAEAILLPVQQCVRDEKFADGGIDNSEAGSTDGTSLLCSVSVVAAATQPQGTCASGLGERSDARLPLLLRLLDGVAKAVWREATGQDASWRETVWASARNWADDPSAEADRNKSEDNGAEVAAAPLALPLLLSVMALSSMPTSSRPAGVDERLPIARNPRHHGVASVDGELGSRFPLLQLVLSSKRDDSV